MFLYVENIHVHGWLLKSSLILSRKVKLMVRSKFTNSSKALGKVILKWVWLFQNPQKRGEKDIFPQVQSHEKCKYPSGSNVRKYLFSTWFYKSAGKCADILNLQSVDRKAFPGGLQKHGEKLISQCYKAPGKVLSLTVLKTTVENTGGCRREK